MSEKTHYRKVFKSDHLGVADLEDLIEANKPLIFTITHVKQEYGVMVAGKKGDYNIAYFKEKIKPLVLNATNSKVMKKFSGSAFVEDWNDITIQLYIDPSAKLMGEVVGGVRIHPERPVAEKKELVPANKVPWENAISAYIRDGNFHAIEKRMTISDENKKKIKQAAEAQAR